MKADPREYLDLEDKLLIPLRRAWHALSADLFAPIADAMGAKDYPRARELAHALDLSDVVGRNRRRVKYLSYSLGRFGAGLVSKSPVFTSGSYEATLTRAANLLTNSVRVNVAKQVELHLLQLIADQENKVEKSAAKVYAKEFVSFRETGDQMLQLVSSLHSSRMAVWGFTIEADVRGVTTYRLTAVLDGRTSRYCEMINGKTFKVEDARKSITRILETENPEDLRILQPWPAQDKKSIEQFKEMSSEELTARGYHIPPFHPGCRTLCAVVGHALVGENTVVETPRTVSTPGDFQGFGNPTQATIDLWNQVVGVSPTEVASKLTGRAPDVIGDMPNLFKFDKQGRALFTASGPLAGAESEVSLQFVWDPATGMLSLGHLEVDASVDAAVAFVGGTYTRATQLLTELGGTQLTVEGLAYPHAELGFLPASAQEWSDLQEAVLQDLLPSGDLHHLWPTDPTRQQALETLLDHQDPKGLWALAAFPDIGVLLLAGRVMQLTYDTTDPESKRRFEDRP